MAELDRTTISKKYLFWHEQDGWATIKGRFHWIRWAAFWSCGLIFLPRRGSAL